MNSDSKFFKNDSQVVKLTRYH